MPFAEACCSPLVTGTVSDCPQSPDAGFKVSVDHHLIGVELDLNTVEQSFVAGNAGSHLVRARSISLDIRSVRWGNAGTGARHGILQGGNQVVAAEALLRGPASSLEVTEGLNHDSSSAGMLDSWAVVACRIQWVR